MLLEYIVHILLSHLRHSYTSSHLPNLSQTKYFLSYELRPLIDVPCVLLVILHAEYKTVQ